MMMSLNGYIDGNRVIVDETIDRWQGKKVIVTILDASFNPLEDKLKSDEDARMKAATEELFGLWKDHSDENSVDAIVRTLRRGRNFDI